MRERLGPGGGAPAQPTMADRADRRAETRVGVGGIPRRPNESPRFSEMATGASLGVAAALPRCFICGISRSMIR